MAKKLVFKYLLKKKLGTQINYRIIIRERLISRMF